ncbi:MAG TPA: response regulator [Ktedonobacteraceae bacterium]|nr:response regulator [Ktedonobacteraceae bacterium]
MSKAHILVVDDDPSILDMIQLLLEQEGYRVTTSLVVLEDLADVERLQPDLIILDFKMSERESGWTFLQKLKLHRPTKHIPLFLCTAALSDVREQEPILAQKGIPIVYKPFDVEELLATVEQMLGPGSSEPE